MNTTILLLLGIAIAETLGINITHEESGAEENESDVLILEDTLYKATRFKRGLSSRSSASQLGNFFDNNRQRPERFCNRKLSTGRMFPDTEAGRINSRQSNTILQLALTKEETGTHSVEFFEEFEPKKHIKREYNGKFVEAYYFPYLAGGIVENGRLNVGWVDIPLRPSARKNEPKLAITGGMNGCVTLVMSLKKPKTDYVRVYHLQSPSGRKSSKENNYKPDIDVIKRFHTDVDNIITSFSWDDYGGYDTGFGTHSLNQGYAPEATIILHYDSGDQRWYYFSQLNLNNKKVNVKSHEETVLYGKTFQTLYSQLRDDGRPPRNMCNPKFD